MCHHGLISHHNEDHEADVDQQKNLFQRRRRRQRQRQRHHQRHCCLIVFLLIASSYLCMVQQPCNGSDDANSSIRRYPPPPPSLPSSSRRKYASTTTTNEIDNIKENYSSSSSYNPNSNDINRNYMQQQPQQHGYYDSTDVASFPPKQRRSSIPIHYKFPVADDDKNDKERQTKISDGNDDDSKNGISARNDLITRYWSKKVGKIQIQTSVAIIGYASGTFTAKALIGGSDAVAWTGLFWAFFLVVSTWFRTPLGELSRAVGLSMILILQRTQQIRTKYPTWRYVAASMGIGRGGGGRDARGRPTPRRGPRPFPPAQNPWKYVPRSSRDPDFNMIYALISIAMVGSAVGGNMPFIPSWIGALLGASSSAFVCTWQDSPRGDLARSCAMRVVAACTELWKIQADLQIIPKTTVVTSQIIDKCMILDRKHQVKNRFLSFANKGYESASKVAEQIQQQQRNRGGLDNKDDRESRRDDDRMNNDNKDLRYRRNRESLDSDDKSNYARSGQEGGYRRRGIPNDDDDNDGRYFRTSSSSRFDNEERRFRRRNNIGEQSSEYRNYDDRENYSRKALNDDTSFDDEKPEKKAKGFSWRR